MRASRGIGRQESGGSPAASAWVSTPAIEYPGSASWQRSSAQDASAPSPESQAANASRHDGAARDGQASAVFTALLPAAGEYDVQVAWTRNANRATRVPVTITHAGGTRQVTVNQREQPPIEGHFASVGRYRFGTTASVTITNAGTDGHVIVDAVRFVPVA